MDFGTEAGALAVASDKACHMVRGDRHPVDMYGERIVVDAPEVLVQEVLGFSNDATYAGRLVV